MKTAGNKITQSGADYGGVIGGGNNRANAGSTGMGGVLVCTGTARGRIGPLNRFKRHPRTRA